MLNTKAMTADPAELRKELPIPYVMAHYGHHPASETSGRFHYISPFREDTNPSFDVFANDQGEQRWGDFAESTQGGVIDLIQRFEPKLNSKDAIARARQLYSDFLTDGWDGPVIDGKEREAVDPAEFAARLEAAAPAEHTVFMADLLRERPGIPNDLAAWGLRVDGDELLVPYLDLNTGDLCGIRFRSADGTKWFANGSRPGAYALPWAGQKRVLLVEGETDAWAAHGSLGEEFWVVSVPGVGRKPHKLLGDLLDKCQVFVGFDSDEAGRKGAKEFSSYLQQRDCEVFYVPLPEGKDWASLPASMHAEVVNRARPILHRPEEFLVTPTGYGVQMGKEVKVISNFVLIPDKVYRSETGAYWYRVRLNPGHETVVLPETALSSQRALQTWASQNRRAWSGGSIDHTKLAAWLQYESTFLPEGAHITRPGLYRSTFAWPEFRVGPDDVVWVDNERIPGIPQMFDPPGRLTEDEVRALVRAYSPDVMAPMLGWLAMAPLRSKYPRFPILFITGRSGSGKTSLASTVIRKFSGTRISVNLTSTTPYAAQNFYGLSNAFPVWFDEYRPGANKQALAAINQLIRDGYNGQPSVRGGMTSDLTKVTALPTDSPVVISGEDIADETSHRERMIRLYLDPKKRGYLGTLEDAEGNLMWDYLHWLTGSNAQGVSFVEEPPTVEPWGPEELRDRQRWNLGVIRTGWDLFTSFVEDVYGIYDLPEADWSQVVEGAVEDTQTDQVLDVLLYLYEQSEADAVWLDKDGCMCVCSGKVVEVVKRSSTLILPMSSPKALTQYLVQNYGGESKQIWNPVVCKQVRSVLLPKSSVDVSGSLGI